MTPPIRVVVADDEPLARQRIEDMLTHEPNVVVVASVGDGTHAVEAIRTHAPDIVFLDIQMPGFTGLEVVRAIGADRMPPTIFVTAFDQHAIKAFDLSAIDYLVKPFDDERFEQAFRRARQQVELGRLGGLRDQLLSLLSGQDSAAVGPAALPNAGESVAGDYLERIPVETRGKTRIVSVADIDYITASGPYAELHIGDKVLLIRESMQVLEDRLDPWRFVRIHRSIIVRLELIDTLMRASGGDYEVRLKTGATLRVSRARREELERRLGIAG